MWDYRRLRTDIVALALFAVTLFVGASMLSFDPADPPARLTHPLREQPLNLCGEIGAGLAYWLRLSFGLAAWFIPLGLLGFDLQLMTRGPVAAPRRKMFGIAMMTAAASVLLHLIAPEMGSGQLVGSGGYVGAWGVAAFERHFATTGLIILLGSVFVSGLTLSTDGSVAGGLIRVILLPFALIIRLLFGPRGESPKKKSRAAKPTLPEDEPIDRRGALSRRETEVVPATIALADLPDEDDPEAEDAVAADVPEPDRPALKVVAAEPEEPADEAVAAPVLAVPAAGKTKEIRVNPPVAALSQRDAVMAKLEAASQSDAESGLSYVLPSLELLSHAEEFPFEMLAKKARVAAMTLEKTFQEFGLNVRVVEIDTGPVITQFELELEAGLRLSKVTALADDLAIALRVPAVRVVAPIPGKNTVGVEVPNEKQVTVRLREIIEACPQDVEEKRIPLFLGKDVSGRPMVVDMAKMPHLLIAGRTGTGKSVCLNSLILSILMTRTPEQVRMLMIDPKMVELSPYKRIPHLMHPVITDMKKAEAVLAWAVDKMEERYDLLARVGVRHLDSYNKMDHAARCDRMGIDPDSEDAQVLPKKMPYIVIIADEMADMMMTSGKDVEGHIIRLAQKSRAVGIHLVLATQKPTVDVITGLIKSNLPARIAFQVASRTDSRVVLDENGADKLLGNGDMLFLAPGTSSLRRAQGTYVSDDEVNGIIDYFGQYEPEYSAELAQISTSSASSSGAKGEGLKSRDELYEQAIDVVVREGRGSVSLLQRALGIGYGRAARLVDFMAEDGIVGDYNGSQAREVLFTPEQWAAFRAGGGIEEPAGAFEDD